MVRRGHEVRDDRSLADQRSHAAEDAEGDVFVSGEAVDERYGDDVEAQSERQPRGRVEELFRGAVAQILVQGWAVVCVENQLW